MAYTVVSFHAHPDDEALLTAGTLARAAAEGHRVVLVTATDGGAGLAAAADSGGPGLGSKRLAELRRAGTAIGCHDVRYLGYRDSGPTPAGPTPAGPADPGPDTFSRADTEVAATRLAAILAETGAHVLTIYDPAGGYGHPDHVQVHRVGVRAAELAGTQVVLEATVDRRPLVRVLGVLERLRILGRLGVDRREWSAARFAGAYADPGRITHRVATRRFAGAKRRAMAAHATQAGADEGVRTLAVFLRLPRVVFAQVFSHEWFVERGRTPATPPLDDIFATLRLASQGDGPTGAEPDRAAES